jgi:hypothetical protein
VEGRTLDNAVVSGAAMPIEALQHQTFSLASGGKTVTGGRCRRPAGPCGSAVGALGPVSLLHFVAAHFSTLFRHGPGTGVPSLTLRNEIAHAYTQVVQISTILSE